LPPAVSAKDLSGGRTQILHVRSIKRIHRLPVESDENFIPLHILDTEDWLYWIGDSGNPNHCEGDYAVDGESGTEQDTCIEGPECPEQWDVSAMLYVPGLIRPTRKYKRQAEVVLVMVNAIKTWRNKGVKKK
jgi:hypothetical protein